MGIKVTNPHPCLINVATGTGRFVRIAPLETVEVEEKSVARLLKSGRLERAGGHHAVERDREADEVRKADEAKKAKG